MTKNCMVCGRAFETNRPKQVTCGDTDCKRIYHNEYQRIYLANRRKEKRSEINEYNRQWMRDYRTRKRLQKAAEEKERQSRQNFTAEGYAERQMQKTLAVVGKIKVE